MVDQDIYNASFYDAFRQGSLLSARRIVPRVLSLMGCKSVVDVGCGVGTWLRIFREYGIVDYLGIDGDYVDRESLEIPPDRFFAHDLRRALTVDRHFDLVVSLEVAEHLPADNADRFLETLTSLGPVVLFSAAIPFQRGNNHINEQWPQYWARRFAARGYVAVDCIRRQVWDDEQVEPWYAQNTLMYVQESRLPDFPALAAARAHSAAEDCLAMVHPKLYVMARQQAQSAISIEARLEQIPVKRLLAALPGRILRAMGNRLRSVAEMPRDDRKIPLTEN